MISGAMVGLSAAFGGQFRVARRWVQQMFAQGMWGRNSNPPVAMTPQEELLYLRTALMKLPTVPERIGALKLLFERRPQDASIIVIEALSHEKHPEMIAWLIRMLGALRHGSTLGVITPYLDDPRPAIAAAAVDAIGLTLGLPTETSGYQTQSTPPILFGFERHGTYPVAQTAEQKSELISRLLPLMTGSAHVEVREAAARALVDLPSPNYQLRVVEWGVLVASGTGYTLPQTIIDEIPPFVHRTGNPLAELEQGRPKMFISAKPIIHITASATLAVDLEIYIRGGRPWFAYPKPDDMLLEPMPNSGQLGARSVPPNVKMEQFDNASLGKIEGLAEGYPWTSPGHRSLVNAYAYDALGLRWQSVIVSPKQPPWMKLPQVPADPKFQWWPHLRDVPSSWVCSRNESERFLYYDGPTLAPAPMLVRREGSKLNITLRNVMPGYMQNPIGAPAKQTVADPERKGIFVQVEEKVVRWAVLVINGPIGQIFEPTLQEGKEADASAALAELLTERGMTPEEAAGLVDAWSEQFFRTNGSRFIARMTPDDYDLLFPMNIRPRPTTLIRVGLILTEFDPSPSTQPSA
jgi:hypothetical protein